MVVQCLFRKKDVIFRSIRISNMASNNIGVYLLQFLAALLFLAALFCFVFLTFLMNECVLYQCTFKISEAAFIHYILPHVQRNVAVGNIEKSSSSFVPRCSEKGRRHTFRN